MIFCDILFLIAVSILHTVELGYDLHSVNTYYSSQQTSFPINYIIFDSVETYSDKTYSFYFLTKQYALKNFLYSRLVLIHLGDG